MRIVVAAMRLKQEERGLRKHPVLPEVGLFGREVSVGALFY